MEGPQRLPGEAVNHVVLETRAGGECGAAVHRAHVRAVARPRPVPAMTNDDTIFVDISRISEYL